MFQVGEEVYVINQNGGKVEAGQIIDKLTNDSLLNGEGMFVVQYTHIQGWHIFAEAELYKQTKLIKYLFKSN